VLRRAAAVYCTPAICTARHVAYMPLQSLLAHEGQPCQVSFNDTVSVSVGKCRAGTASACCHNSSLHPVYSVSS
jgi:hypothetical protein